MIFAQLTFKKNLWNDKHIKLAKYHRYLSPFPFKNGHFFWIPKKVTEFRLNVDCMKLKYKGKVKLITQTNIYELCVIKFQLGCIRFV